MSQTVSIPFPASPSGGVMNLTIDVTVNANPPVVTSLVDKSPIGPLSIGQVIKRSLDCLDQYGKPIATPPDAAWQAVISAPIATVSVSGGQLVVTALPVTTNQTAQISFPKP